MLISLLEAVKIRKTPLKTYWFFIHFCRIIKKFLTLLKK